MNNKLDIHLNRQSDDREGDSSVSEGSATGAEKQQIDHRRRGFVALLAALFAVFGALSAPTMAFADDGGGEGGGDSGGDDSGSGSGSDGGDDDDDDDDDDDSSGDDDDDDDDDDSSGDDDSSNEASDSPDSSSGSQRSGRDLNGLTNVSPDEEKKLLGNWGDKSSGTTQ